MKVCSKCKTEKDDSEFAKDYRYEGKTVARCKICWNAYCRIRRKNPTIKYKIEQNELKYRNKSTTKKKIKKYCVRTRKRRTETMRLWRINNKEKEHNIANNRDRIERQNLSDRYIKKVLSQGLKIKVRDLPKGHLETKRLIILLRRELKNKKQ